MQAIWFTNFIQVNQMKQLLKGSKFNDIKGIKVLPTFDLQGKDSWL